MMVDSKELQFVQIKKSDKKQVAALVPLWIAYIHEIYKGDKEVENMTDYEIENWLIRRVNIQGECDTMHFEMIMRKEEPIGFAMFAVDLGGIRNVLDGGYGYIMEFYIKPPYRRKRIGAETYRHIVRIFQKHGVPKIYLTPESENAVPFWKAMGFAESGKIDPDNDMPIYISNVMLF